MRPAGFNRRLALLLLALMLGGCGFRLAGEDGLPPQLARIQLLTSGFDQRQRDALRARLREAGAEVSLLPMPDAAQLRASLEILPSRRMATSASNGRIIERVARGLEFSVKGADGMPLLPTRSLLQQKDIALDDDNLLSSDVERQRVIAGLESALYEQLLRQLKRL